jgi:Ca-activated chloride channel family protein
MTSQSNSPASQRVKQVFLPLLGSLILAAAFLILEGSSWSRAQQQAPPAQQQKEQEQYKIRSEVNMVLVPTTVRKPGGGFVKGLPKEAFRVTEDGEDQEIITFSQESLPTRIAIVLDISGSVRQEWGTIKFATRKFVESLLPEDQFSLVTFNTETRLKMDWGNKTDRLDEVLSSIYCKDNTNLWDTIWVVANDVFKGIREKKAMIIMSDGLDNNSFVAYKDALAAAVRSEAAIYVVSKTEAVRQTFIDDLAKQGYYAGIPEQEFAQADLALRKLAYETGGRVLYPNTFGQLGNVYAEVDEELRNQYNVGYISSNTAKDGSYRRIQVAVNSPGAQIAARPGYYAPSNLPPGKK